MNTRDLNKTQRKSTDFNQLKRRREESPPGIGKSHLSIPKQDSQTVFQYANFNKTQHVGHKTTTGTARLAGDRSQRDNSRFNMKKHVTQRINFDQSSNHRPSTASRTSFRGAGTTYYTS